MPTRESEFSCEAYPGEDNAITISVTDDGGQASSMHLNPEHAREMVRLVAEALDELDAFNADPGKSWPGAATH